MVRRTTTTGKTERYNHRIVKVGNQWPTAFYSKEDVWNHKRADYFPISRSKSDPIRSEIVAIDFYKEKDVWNHKRADYFPISRSKSDPIRSEIVAIDFYKEKDGWNHNKAITTSTRKDRRLLDPKGPITFPFREVIRIPSEAR